MSNNTNIILTGFMATGKTTIGRLLARSLGYTFIDTDQVIEKRCGLSIANLFEQRGEQVFREMETLVAKELSLSGEQVISTGGGLMLNPVNASHLDDSGTVFCLVASAEEIYNRLLADHKTQRPLLQKKNPLGKILALTKARARSYSQFIQIDTTGKTPPEVTREILVLVG